MTLHASQPTAMTRSTHKGRALMLGALLLLCAAQGLQAQTAPTKPAAKSSDTAKPEAATAYVDKLSLAGKEGLEAARALDAQGFKTCQVVGGALPNVSKEEPMIQCDREGANPYACKRFEVVLQMDWADRTLPVPEMLEQIMATKVLKATTICI